MALPIHTRAGTYERKIGAGEKKCKLYFFAFCSSEAHLAIRMEQVSPFLKLPRELRDKILAYACEGKVFKVQGKDLKQSDSIRPRPGLKYDPDLLLVNHQICEEAKGATIVAYTRNTFHFESPSVLECFASKLPSCDITAIQRLHLDITTVIKDTSTLRCWFRVLSDVLVDQFLGLRDLYVSRKADARPLLWPKPEKSRTKYCRMRRVKKPETGKSPDS